jgi:hypothetical protein
MSTFQITIPDSLAERMTSEEIQRFLQKQVQHLSESNDVDIFLSTSQVSNDRMFHEASDFSLQEAIQAKARQNIDFYNHPFIGMWADRADMADSTEYVRNLRMEMNRFPVSSSTTP